MPPITPLGKDQPTAVGNMQKFGEVWICGDMYAWIKHISLFPAPPCIVLLSWLRTVYISLLSAHFFVSTFTKSHFVTRILYIMTLSCFGALFNDTNRWRYRRFLPWVPGQKHATGPVQPFLRLDWWRKPVASCCFLLAPPSSCRPYRGVCNDELNNTSHAPAAISRVGRRPTTKKALQWTRAWGRGVSRYARHFT